MIYQLLINTLTGAGTGYITNNIAIKMLFKKYFGRFGGMIEDTHEDFVENISQLIEKDLINHHTLEDEFNSEKFHLYIKELVKDMFVNSLPKNSIDLKNIEGIYDTKENIVNFLDKNKKHRKALKRKLASKPFKHALSHLQVLHFSKQVADVLDVNKAKYIEEASAPLKDFKINTLLSDELLSKLTQNIQTIIYHIDFAKFDDSIDEAISEILKLVNLDEILNLGKVEIENIYFKQIFSANNSSSSELINKMIEIALSKEGEVAISSSVHAILDALANVDVSILSLLDDDITESIKEFIRLELPNIIDKIIDFIDENEKDLENLINSSINNALDDGAFSDLKKKLVAVFYTNIVADFKVLTRVKEYMHQYQDLAGEEISTQVINILENKSIGEIYQAIAKKNIITPKKVIELVIKNLKKFNTNKEFPLLDVILQKQVKDYTKVNLDFVKNTLLPSSIEKVKKEFIYTDRLKDLIFKETKGIIDTLKVKTLHEVLDKRFSLITQEVISYIDKDKLLETILQNANEVLGKPIKDVINIDEVEIDYRYYMREMIDTKSIKEVITYMQSEEVYIAVESALIKVIIDNLEEILKGNVSEAVKKELTKLPPSQIKDMVEEFMGEELKPINYFGAVLGGVAGASVGAVSIPIWANPFIYGVVGVATNYLAIKMLFQPYAPLKIGKFKVPFSEGVLPSNKAKMAIKMSEFVDEFMLNGTSIQDFFEHNSSSLKEFIKLHIAQDNFSVIDKLIHQNSNINDVSDKAVTLIFNFLDTNQEMISDKIYNISMTYYENRDKYAKKAQRTIYNELMKREFGGFLYEEFEKFVDKEKSLSFISQELFSQLDIFTEKAFDSLTNALTYSSEMQKIIINFEPFFEKYITSHSINQTINESLKKAVSKKINSSLIDLFYGKKTINELLNFFTKGEFNSQSKLSDMINGMLPTIIERNLNLIINETILPALKEHKQLIRKEIMQKVPFGAGWIVKRDVNRTIDIILDEKVPKFVEDKSKQINIIIQEVLDTQLIKFGYTNSAINQRKVDDLMSGVLASNNFSKSFAKSMDIFAGSIFEMKLKTLLQIFNITKLSEIFNLFEPNILPIATLLNKNINSQKKQLIKTIKKLTQDDIASRLLESLQIKDLLIGVDKEMLLREFHYLEQNLKKSTKMQEVIKKIINNFITIFMQREFLDKKVFKEDIDRFLSDIIKDKEELRDILIPFFQEFILNINEMLDLKLKNHMLDIIIDSAFESINAKIVELMGAVDFKKVITKEIQEMHPKELEDMFYSFAGPYFNKLILYGSLGFLFGLVTLVGV
ncbi:MAG: DUF445 family protein [Sulfurimonas sp.]